MENIAKLFAYGEPNCCHGYNFKTKNSGLPWRKCVLKQVETNKLNLFTAIFQNTKFRHSDEILLKLFAHSN